MTCHDVRLSLGVYVLGKAEPAERALVDAHLERCRDCRDELDALQALPGLLALARPRDLESGARGGASGQGSTPSSRTVLDDRPTPDQLHRLLGAAAAGHARRRWLSLAAAALVVVVAGLGGLLVATRDSVPERPPAVVATWSATAPTSGLKATVTLTPRPAGTAVDLTLSGIPAGTRCSLVVTSVDGNVTSAASWEADYEGTATVTGFTATPVGQIARMTIVTSTGQTLATLSS